MFLVDLITLVQGRTGWRGRPFRLRNLVWWLLQRRAERVSMDMRIRLDDLLRKHGIAFNVLDESTHNIRLWALDGPEQKTLDQVADADRGRPRRELALAYYIDPTSGRLIEGLRKHL